MLRISALSSFGLPSVPAASGPFLCQLSLRGGGDEIAASSAWCRGSLQVGYAFGGEPNSFCSKAKINRVKQKCTPKSLAPNLISLHRGCCGGSGRVLMPPGCSGGSQSPAGRDGDRDVPLGAAEGLCCPSS